MAPNPRRLDARLDALYDQLPSMSCKGLCHDSCGPIEMTVRERQRIRERTGEDVTCGMGATCSMLTPDRKCGVYDIRPMICRGWGLTRTMRCPYGCEPDDGFMEDADLFRLLGEADVVGGRDGGRTERLQAGILQALQSDPEERARANALARAMYERPTINGRFDTLDRSNVPSAIERKKR